MTKLLLIALSLCITTLHAQVFSPKTVVLPDDPDKVDFSFLKQELKDVEVVLLGENSHYDGNVFEAKTQIIEYLYSELGFKTVAFESGVYDVWRAQREIKSGTNAKTALHQSLFPIWSKTKEFQSFIYFFDTYKSDLKLVGFDNQTTGKYGESSLFIDLFDYCRSENLPLELDRGDLELLMESVYASRVFDEHDISYKEFYSEFKKLLGDIGKLPKSENRFYWSQIVKSLLSVGKDCHEQKSPIISSFYTTTDDNTRDRQMADNLLAYLAENPNEKIICWGANQHFANGLKSVEVPILRDFVPMGSYLKQNLNEKVFSLAMVSAQDSIHLNGKWHKTPVESASFEAYLKNLNQNHAYISSRQPHMEQSVSLRLFSPETFVLGKPGEMHDGYLYFRDIRPSTFLDDDNTAVQKLQTLPSNQSFLPDSDTELLKEVVIKSRKTPYSIVRKTIENIPDNYPTSGFGSKLYSTIQVTATDSVLLDMEFTASQYEKGYDQIQRSFRQIEEIRWNVKNGYEPKSIGSEFYRTYIHNPIRYGRFLDQRKFRKFVFTEDEPENLDGTDVFVIHFTTLRDQFSYTDRSYQSNFSGTLYINQSDYALLKIIENWEVIGYPSNQDQEHELSGWPEKYVKRETAFETCETTFSKKNGAYFMDAFSGKIRGTLFESNGNLQPFEINVASFWGDFEAMNPKKIKLSEEQNLFEKAKFRAEFWEDFKNPQ